MAQPTLVYTTTTVTLPYPQDTTEDPGVNDAIQVSFDGHSRVQRLYRKYTWTLNFTLKPYSTWASIRSLWETARTAGAFPSFSFTEVWTDASSIPVVMTLGAFTPYGPNPTVGAWTLTLTSVAPY